MIYGLQIGAALLDRSLEEGLEYYEYLTDIAKLESVELDFSHPALFTDGVRPRILPSEIDGNIERRLSAFVKPYKVKGAHLQYSSMGVYSISNNPYIQRESRSIIKLGIKKAAKLGLGYVTIHLEGQVEASKDRRHQLFKEAALDYLKYAEAYGVVVTIENGDIIEGTRIVKEIDNPYLKTTLDVGHAYLPIQNTMYGRVDRYIELEAETIRNIHAHDHDGVKRDHLPIGMGVINFQAIIKALRRVNYDGSINLEIGLRFEQENHQRILDSIERLRSYEQA